MGKKHLALFNGIGGFQLAASWAGWENVAHVEIDDWCNKVVARHFPESKCHKDIYDFNGTEYNGTIDIISGGFPCQPFSVAGKRQGEKDNRFLWFEMLRVIREVQPTWVVAENVAGILSMENGKTFEKILLSLEDAKYEVEPFIIPACAVGAWHRRDRIWIVCHSECDGYTNRYKETRGTKQQGEQGGMCKSKGTGLQYASDTEVIGIQRYRSGGEQKPCSHGEKGLSVCEGEGGSHAGWEFEPAVGRVANGVPNRVDRIKGLGNAIVPQVAYEIFMAINQYSFEKADAGGAFFISSQTSKAG